ncbi:MAG: hypothetical protein SGILL_004136 [Bacillariaceae sp.]
MQPRKLEGEGEQQQEGEEHDDNEERSEEGASDDNKEEEEVEEEQNEMQQYYQNQYNQQQMAQEYNDYSDYDDQQYKEEVAEQYYGQEEEENENSEDGEAEDANFINNFMFRVDGDLYNMWNSSPSEWITEYWEVLAVFGVLFFLVGVLLCYVFCIVPCCSTYDSTQGREGDMGDPHAGGRVVGTESEMEKHLENKKRRLFGRRKKTTASDEDTVTDAEDYEAPFIRMDDVGETPSQAAASSPVSTFMSASSAYPEDSDTVPQALSSNTEGALSPRSTTSGGEVQSPKKERSVRMASVRGKKGRRSKQGQKGGSSLWSETVDVWSEFLGFKNTTYNIRGADKSDLLAKNDTMTSAPDRYAPGIISDVEEENIGKTKGKPPLSPRSSNSSRKIVSPVTAPAMNASGSGTVPLTTIDSAQDDSQRIAEIRSTKSKDKSSGRSTRTSVMSNKSKNLQKKTSAFSSKKSIPVDESRMADV